MSFFNAKRQPKEGLMYRTSTCASATLAFDLRSVNGHGGAKLAFPLGFDVDGRTGIQWADDGGGFQTGGRIVALFGVVLCGTAHVNVYMDGSLHPFDNEEAAQREADQMRRADNPRVAYLVAPWREGQRKGDAEQEWVAKDRWILKATRLLNDAADYDLPMYLRDEIKAHTLDAPHWPEGIKTHEQG